MNLILFIVIFILYAVLIGITFGNMKVFDLKTKLIYLIIGIIVNLIITSIIVNISKINIENNQNYNIIKNIDILIFTAVNSIITIPTIGKYLNNEKIDILSKQEKTKKILILFAIYIIILIFEINYLKGLKV